MNLSRGHLTQDMAHSHLYSSLLDLVNDYEEPFCDASMLPTALLSKFTKNHVKVALSGDGADELFGGYYRYRVIHLCRIISFVPQKLRRSIANAILSVLPPKIEERTFWGQIRRLVEINNYDGLEQYFDLVSHFPSDLKTSLYGEKMRESSFDSSIHFLQSFHSLEGKKNFVDSIMEVDIMTYLNNDILVKVDRASMNCGLEVRSPFLDIDVAGLAMRLPYHWKQKGKTRKRILADTFSGQLPTTIFKRKKMGFGVPIARWLRNDWKQSVNSLLLSGHLVNDRYFKQERLQWLLAMHQDEKADFSNTIFALLVLELWMQQHPG